MSSIIPGFEYDIFISYRQKDNKYDGWVTDFVDNLNRELEATFKEEISVYFDINPHDGLLETHDVDASLKEKLKCLIFIPVISRTYCDKSSFAWNHEFRAFVDQASSDQFGLKVRLPDGNVSARILPVRIHDLDKADVELCESILGGVLRGIEFVYKSSGVNRPLRSQEDNPHDNLNRTIYRDQINKVALSVKGLIEGMRSTVFSIREEAESRQEKKQIIGDHASSALKGIISFLMKPQFIVPFLFVVFALLFTFSSSSSVPFNKRDWVIITDFENTTGDTIFDRSLYTALTLTTNQSRYINVLPRSRMLETMARMEIRNRQYIDDKTGREIAARENIDLYVVPGISSVGGQYVISARILETSSGDLLRSEVLYADNKDEILPNLDHLSRKIRRSMGESRYRIATQDKPLSLVTTSSLEALKLFSTGIEKHLMLDFAGARDYYERALSVDTGFTAARASLGNLLIERFDPERGKELLKQAIRSVDNLTDKEKYGILGFYAVNVENDIPKGIDYTKRLTDLYPDDPTYHNNLGWYYQMSMKYEEAAAEYKTAVRINPSQALTYGGLVWLYLEDLGDMDSAMVWSRKMITDNPDNVWGYIYLGSAWFGIDSLAQAENAFRKAAELNPSLTFNLFRLAYTCSARGNYYDAIEILKKAAKVNPDETFSSIYGIGVNYQLLGDRAEAAKYFSEFRKNATEVWLKKWPDDPASYIVIGMVSARTGDMEYSQEMLEKAIGIDSTKYVRIAELLCQQGKIPEAIIQIEKALKSGYRDLVWLKMSPDLQVLRYDVRFRKVLDQYFP
jgi:tetratricopeptide (TPR) repeat protein